MIRPLTDTDIPTVTALHTQNGYDYKMPDLTSPLFPVKLLDLENGRVVAACALKLQVETYLWVDPAASTKVRLRAIMELSKAVYGEAWKLGLDCMVAWLPPGLPPAFVRVLHKIGWARDRDSWHSWSKEVK